jgi:hypothetical protein
MRKLTLALAGVVAALGLSACHSGTSATAICVDSKPVSNIGVTFAAYKAGTPPITWAICAGDNNSIQCGWEGYYAEDPHRSYNVHCNFSATGEEFTPGVDPDTFATF